MIEFTREGSIVKVKVTGKYPVANLAWNFNYNAGSDAYAALLADNFKQHLWETIKEIRRVNYERGWSDAKSHKRVKRDYFSGSLNTDSL